MKKFFKNLRQKVARAILTASILVPQVTMMVCAETNKITESKEFKAFMKLMDDVCTALLVVVGGLWLKAEAEEIIKWFSAEPNEKGRHIKEMQKILLVAIIAAVIPGVGKIILSYFK